MGRHKQLPEDYAVLAMAAEAQRRGYGVHYGNLMAATTPEERERIKERYRSSKYRSREKFVVTDTADED